MRNVICAAVALGLSAGALTPARVLADEPHAKAEPSYWSSESRIISSARKFFLEGQRAFRRGRFEEALGSYRFSFGLVRNPEVLLRIADTADRLRRDREAADALRDYLTFVPRSPQREELRARIRILDDSTYVRAQDTNAPFPLRGRINPNLERSARADLSNRADMVDPWHAGLTDPWSAATRTPPPPGCALDPWNELKPAPACEEYWGLKDPSYDELRAELKERAERRRAMGNPSPPAGKTTTRPRPAR
jgi:hypothetical protein